MKHISRLKIVHGRNLWRVLLGVAAQNITDKVFDKWGKISEDPSFDFGHYFAFLMEGS